jgi:peptide/nickel transport system substrate-binding protein
MRHSHKLLRAVLLSGATALGTSVFASEPTSPPDPPAFSGEAKITFVDRSAIEEYKGLAAYQEPDWVTEQFVKTGKLPPVKERLPKEPLVFKTGNMPDGVGVYGDTMRHVIGGRPEGWNYTAGQSQGWGGLDIALWECLTRTAPLFQVKAEDLEPLPNLAKGWDWSGDGHTLTMHLIEGAKWSDGQPFTADDPMFYWQLLHDSNISPLNGATLATFGEGTTLESPDPYTLVWKFKQAFPKQYLFNMAYGTFCPGPAHVLKPLYPPNSGKTYDQYKNAFPATYMNFPTMGAWVPVAYRENDIVVLRRNPYYWKVDEAGHQLPYLNEMHYKLSTWADRDVQAVAGSGDFSNLEQPESFVESLKRAAQPDAPARIAFGPRIIAYSLLFNMSANGWGEPDERGDALRELARNEHFRKAVTMAIDRAKLGQSLVKGPFTTIYPGGLLSGTGFYDKTSTVYYPYDLAGAKEELAKAGVVDADGKGGVNFPKGMANGDKIAVTLLANSDYQTDKTLAEGVQTAMQALGIRVIINAVDGKQFDAIRYAGKTDWQVLRDNSDLMSVVQNTEQLAAVGPRTSDFHRAGKDGTLDLLPFEKDLADTIVKFTTTIDPRQRLDLMKQYQKLYTSNVYGVGLTQYPGALIINKRFANIPPGTPINMYNWAEDSIIRERVYVPAAKQGKYELYVDTLPGRPGGDGPVKQ